MNHHTKIIALLIAIMLSLTALTPALAQEDGIFDTDIGWTVYQNKTFYAVAKGNVYAWAPDDSALRLYCTLPVPPMWEESWCSMTLDELPTDAQNELTAAVDMIAAGDGALWGYNLISGKVGKINEQGITWETQTIDTSCLFRKDSIMNYVTPIFSFVEDGKLYIFGDNSHQVEPLDDTKALLCFDLASGRCTTIDTKGARTLCHYKQGSLLLLRRNTSSSMTLSVLDLTTGEMNDLPQIVPYGDRSYEGLESVGGLAYDAAKDQIYFTMQKQIWRSKDDNSFESVAKLPFDSYLGFPAWILPDGRYAITMYCNLYLRNID